MGNISCVKSNSSKSHDDNKGSSRYGRNTKTNSIPRIVLDPGSTLSEPTQNEGDDEQESEVDMEKAHSDSKERSLPTITATNEIRELYAITPSNTLSDSSDEEGAAENTPLMTNEESASQGVTDQKLNDSQTALADSSRPLLTRQVEMDEDRDDSKDLGCTSSDCGPETTLKDDDYESQLPIPILFTISPTKGGNSHVSSVIATRDLPAALSRPPSLPTSPKCKSPKSPRSQKPPRSPRSLRGFFTCRGAAQSPDNDVNENIETSAPKIEDTGKVDDHIPKKTVDEICLDDNTATNAETSDIKENNKLGESSRSNVNGESSLNSHKEAISEDSIKMLEGRDVVTAMVPSHEHSTQRLQRNILVNGSATESSFEETANSSDKGYESVDNSPSVEHEDEHYSRSIRANGAVVSNKINDTPNPIWIPLMEETNTFAQPTRIFYSQTMV